MLHNKNFIIGCVALFVGITFFALGLPAHTESKSLFTTSAYAWTSEEEVQLNQIALTLQALESSALFLQSQNEDTITTSDSDGVPVVPFYSQFDDVSDPGWKKLSCGIADLAMLIEYYKPGSITSVDTLLSEGINSGAYIQSAGWSHQGLANLAVSYGLEGRTYDLSYMSMDAAYSELEKYLTTGPIIASVYYKFEYGHPIPHLVVINGVDGNTVYYNDPATDSGNKSLSVDAFKSAWKKRFIVIRPNVL